jgi:hypothetical protein
MPPKFSRLLTDILAPEGDKVTFECCVNGDPKPDIKWYLNNEEIQDSEQIQVNTDLLQLESVISTWKDKFV